MTTASRAQGTVALVVTAALWGSNHVVARAARDIVPLPSLVFWRWGLAVLALTFIALPSLRQAWPAIRARLGDMIFGGAIGVGLFSYFLLGGAYQSLAIEVSFINATTPVWVLLITLGLRRDQVGDDAVTPVMIGGIALAFAGTLLIICKGEIETLTSLRFSLGNFWSLLAAISFAWISLRVRDWGRTIPALPLMVVTGWSGVLLVMLPVYLGWMVYGGAWLAFDPADAAAALASIAYIAFLPTMLGNLFYLYGVTALGPARAAAFLYLSPLFSAGLAIAWLGERIAWYHIAGIAAIFAGLFLLGRAPAGDQDNVS
ncbi:DMT family transporter [Bradyrhizobium sp.]|uniref:DMT family transporter n=1 Tax=Bradyrhizobium sp. TaxID=376 RepID=UPI001ECFED8A|nr:DMT family transporter [Bradyrhizobium sp.]MBV8919976.1 DMT family transporter [Bradyrhizobium sp.]MBV9980452.1 DMT family transporter [Bradyrhizobium sp.]